MNRREAGKLFVGASLAALGARLAQARPYGSQIKDPGPETRSLDELHRAALAEGGQLTVYGGGDLPNGAAGMEKAFMQRFPGMKIRIFIDRSKYQGVRVDNQLALDKLQCDVVHILAWHYFERWKAAGELLAYKPAGWDKIAPDFRDPDGEIVPVAVYAFSTLVNTRLMAEADAPRNAIELLEPKYKGKLALTYPHDDDSILYQFERIVSQHGWDFITRLMKQDVAWNRGSGATRDVVEKGQRALSFTTSGPIVPAADKPLRFLLPRHDSFLSWAHPAAIMRRSPNQAAARLYMSWLLSPERQGSGQQWSVRSDMPPPKGFEPLAAYNTYPVQFRDFLLDRARVETFRDQLEQYLGPMQGPNSTGVEGVFPEGLRGA